jgi:hypothetical protein
MPVMHDSYDAWLADYKRALEHGSDRHGRDMFDLLYEKMPSAEIQLWFDAYFTRQDQRTHALAAFLELGYDPDSTWTHGTPELPGKWNLGLHAERIFTGVSAKAFRDQISAAEKLLARFDAFDIEWDSIALPPHPGTRPPL